MTKGTRRPAFLGAEATNYATHARPLPPAARFGVAITIFVCGTAPIRARSTFGRTIRVL
jgi:hypothetical protein